MDVEVAHNLTCGADPTDADMPRVIRIENLERIGGEQLGVGELRLDLGDLAVDAVVSVIGIGWIMVHRVGDLTREGEKVWQPPGPENWREVARAIRAAYFPYRRMRWSGQLNAKLLEMVAHIAKHGCGTMTDIADQLGTTPQRVHTQVNQLRKTHDIPRLQPGRPSK